MPDKPIVSREERMEAQRIKDLEGRKAMQEYQEEMAAIDANTLRLRGLRLAREEAAAIAKANEPPKVVKTRKKKVAI